MNGPPLRPTRKHPIRAMVLHRTRSDQPVGFSPVSRQGSHFFPAVAVAAGRATRIAPSASPLPSLLGRRSVRAQPAIQAKLGAPDVFGSHIQHAAYHVRKQLVAGQVSAGARKDHGAGDAAPASNALPWLASHDFNVYRKMTEPETPPGGASPWPTGQCCHPK